MRIGAARTPSPPSPTPAQRARFAAAIDELVPAGLLALAVSGGADSLALLLLAHAARPGAIVAATVDHGLRPSAAAEARSVAAACERLGIPHRTLAVTVADGRSGPQASARTARYAALEPWAVAAGAVALATAHHVDDQAETLLMRLARGAGVGGLAGVRPQRLVAPGLSLIRPLIGWRRDELAAIVATAGHQAVDDPSNRDLRYDRTRVRRLLAATDWLDPGRLAAAADHLRDAEEGLAWAAAMEFDERAFIDAPAIELDPTGLPAELLRRVTRLGLDAATRFASGGAVETIACTGPELTHFVHRLAVGQSATLGLIHATPGGRWRFQPAPARRTG